VSGIKEGAHKGVCVCVCVCVCVKPRGLCSESSPQEEQTTVNGTISETRRAKGGIPICSRATCFLSTRIITVRTPSSRECVCVFMDQGVCVCVCVFAHPTNLQEVTEVPFDMPRLETQTTTMGAHTHTHTHTHYEPF